MYVLVCRLLAAWCLLNLFSLWHRKQELSYAVRLYIQIHTYILYVCIYISLWSSFAYNKSEKMRRPPNPSFPLPCVLLATAQAHFQQQKYVRVLVVYGKYILTYLSLLLLCMQTY